MLYVIQDIDKTVIKSYRFINVPGFIGELCDYAPCPASVGRTLCPGQLVDDVPYPSAKGFNRKRNQQCLIHTPTGRRQCMSVHSKVKQHEAL